MKKLLLTAICCILSCVSIFAESQTIEIEFKSAGNNNAQKAPESLDDIVAENYQPFFNQTTPFAGSNYYTGQYGLRIGQNKNDGNVTLNFTQEISNVSSVELTVSANKNPAKLSVALANKNTNFNQHQQTTHTKP